MKNIFLLNFLILITSNLSPQMTIHIIGDSHTGSFINEGLKGNNQIKSYPYVLNEQNLQIPFVIHWIGPRLMHSFGKDGSIINLQHMNVQNGDLCIFVLGEIDVRCHIGKQRDKKNRNLSKILETLVQNYISAILKKKLEYPRLACVIYNVTPPTNAKLDAAYPYYGSLQDRIEITKQLNDLLKIECEKKGIIFLEAYNIFSTEEGMLNVSYKDDSVHVKSEFSELIRNKLLSMLFEGQN